jgi:hypothetical protein
MELEDPSPHSQAPATSPHPEPDQSRSPPYTLKIHFNIIIPSTPKSSALYLPLAYVHSGRYKFQKQRLLLPPKLRDCLHNGEDRFPQGGSLKFD